MALNSVFSLSGNFVNLSKVATTTWRFVSYNVLKVAVIFDFIKNLLLVRRNLCVHPDRHIFRTYGERDTIRPDQLIDTDSFSRGNGENVGFHIGTNLCESGVGQVERVDLNCFPIERRERKGEGRL